MCNTLFVLFLSLICLFFLSSYCLFLQIVTVVFFFFSFIVVLLFFIIEFLRLSVFIVFSVSFSIFFVERHIAVVVSVFVCLYSFCVTIITDRIRMYSLLRFFYFYWVQSADYCLCKRWLLGWLCTIGTLKFEYLMLRQKSNRTEFGRCFYAP